MPEIPENVQKLAEEARKLIGEAVNISVGLAVMGFNRLQSERSRFMKAQASKSAPSPEAEASATEASATDGSTADSSAAGEDSAASDESDRGAVRQEIGEQMRQLDSLISTAIRVVESSLEPLEKRLPESAQHVATLAHRQAHEVHAQLSRILTSL